MSETLARHELPDRPFATNAGPVAYAWHNATAQNMPAPQPQTASAPEPAPAAPSVSGYAGDPTARCFNEFARSAGIPTEVTAEVEAWWDDAPAQLHHEFANQDALARQEVRAELAQVWGADKVDGNLETIRRYLDSGHVPEGVADVLLDARLKNGKALLNDAPTLVRLFGVAHRAGPPLPKIDPKDVDGVIRQLEGYMRRDRKAYDRDNNAQMRLRAAYAAREEARKAKED